VDEEQDERRRFVVGLGNPGPKYARTRHNVGFRVLEALRRRWDADPPRKAFGGEVCDARPARPGAGERRVLLLAPHTYMNRSGLAVRDMAEFHKAGLDEILVVLDDMDLPPGRVRARAGGSAGGQKGLADVLARLRSEQVPRLRIGIGRPPPSMDGTDFVLTRFHEEEEEIIEIAIQTAADAVEDWVFCGLTFVMEKYNKRPDID
jgi:PTH1 family peptidyl-tRNA hydrolase